MPRAITEEYVQNLEERLDAARASISKMEAFLEEINERMGRLVELAEKGSSDG
jgi:hypothetical protein